MIELTVNRLSRFSIHEQLKHQIRYAILSGELRPGAQLPSIRELTTKLQVNRNTVHRAYLELQAEGILVSKAGTGIFVSSRLNSLSPRMRLNKVDDFVQKVFQEGLQLGLNPLSLSHLLSHRFPEFDRDYPSVVFVECTAHASSEVAAIISQKLGISVICLELDELINKPELLPPSIKFLITSFFHESDVIEMAKNAHLKSFIITYDIQEDSRATLTNLDPSKKIGFVCRDANSVEILSQKIRECHQDLLHLESSCTEIPDQAEKIIANSEIIAFTSPALSFVMERISDKQQSVQIDFELNEHSLDSIRKKILPF